MTKKKPIGSDLSDLPMRPLRPREKWQPDIRTKMPEYVERPATPEEVAMLPGDSLPPVFPRGTLRGLGLHAPLERPCRIHCPWCGSEDIETTLKGGILIDFTPAKQMRDSNRATCARCRHQGNAGDWFAIEYWKDQA